MYVSTEIKSESEGVQLSAFLNPDGKYDSPKLAFYRIEGEYLSPMDYTTQIWDNAVYLVDELYPEVVRCSKLGVQPTDPDLVELLDESRCSVRELKDILTRALQLNFFEKVNSELLKT
jgi:hypothetical protein